MKDRKVLKAVGQIRDNIGIIVAEGDRLTKLINDVLDISKMEAGKIEWKKEPVDVAGVIRHCVAATGALFDKDSLTLSFKVEEGLPRVRGDRDRLIQVVSIASADQPKVFEKFRQVGDTLTNKPKGTGLGLPICKEIIESHSGRIWVESEPGRGSAFSFSLPITPTGGDSDFDRA